MKCSHEERAIRFADGMQAYQTPRGAWVLEYRAPDNGLGLQVIERCPGCGVVLADISRRKVVA